MTKKKSTKRALLMSTLSLMLCLTMFVGSTFAWFTDSVTSANNIIQSGNLDVELEYYTGSDWKTVNGATDLFSKELWEPGHAEVVYLKLSNLGSLALKYQLGINVVSEKGGTNVADAAFNLSDYIYMGVVENVEPTYSSREAAIEAAKSGTNGIIGNGYIKSGSMTADAEELYMAVVVYMPETVGNKANYKSGTDAPEINLGINLIATQMTKEIDSFGSDYDEDADIYSVVVASEAELVAALAEAKNGDIIGISGNVTWTTGAGIGSTPFVASDATTFSMKAVDEKLTYITLKGVDENATFTAIGAGVGAVGIDNGTVIFKDLKIVDESVSYAENSWEYGYLEFRGNTVFENCNIVNAIMMEGTSAKFIDCSFNSNAEDQYAVWVSEGDASFENCSFTGARGIKVHEAYGSEVGTVMIDNNTFEVLTKKPGVAIGTVNTDTSITIANNLFVGTQPGDQNNYKYETDTDVATFNFVDENNTVVAEPVSNPDDLNGAFADNAIVYLTEGEYSLPSLANYEGVTIIGADGAVIGGESAATGFGGNFGKDTTIKNVTFSGSSNGVRYSYAKGGDTVFEKCTFVGDSTYGFHIDQSNGATFTFNDCTFSGFNAFAGDLEKVVFNNCTFLSNGNYGHTNIWSIGEFNNCTWGDKTSVSTRGDNGKLFFDGVEETYHHEFIGSADSLFAFAESVNKGGDSWHGQKVALVDDIDLNNVAWTPIGQTGATEFKGIFDGQNYTISHLNVDSSAQTDGHYSSGLFGWAESGVSIKNVKIDGATVVGNHIVAVLVGYTYSAKISNCQVTNANIACNHANDDACGDKAGLIVGYAGDESRISACSASNSTVTAGRDAGQLIGCGYNVSVSDCTAMNVTVSATGECTGANVNEAVIGRVMN